MNSREKGKRGERRWRDMLRDAGFLKAYRGAQFHGGPDSPDVQCPELPGLHFEVKAVERLNVWEGMAQAERDAGPSKTPVLAHTRSRSGWLVTMRAEDWLTLIRESSLVASPPPSTCDLRPATAPEARSDVGPSLADAPPPPPSNFNSPLQLPHASPTQEATP